MEFRTKIKTPKNSFKIRHSDKIMLIGSCFSNNIGSKLHNALIQTEINPFGTVYNPASILNEIARIISGEKIRETELFQANGMWNHFGFHSQFSKTDVNEALSTMNYSLEHAGTYLKQCDVLFITLGTAIIYENRHTGFTVSNCHKLPAREFNRRMMSCEEVKSCLASIITVLSEYAPQVKVIFTVSPIRHVSDGLEQNQLSKSILRTAVGEFISAHNDRCGYFPAYEIMMDDLRDYRFYAADMVHPSDIAIEYIWDTFKDTYFDECTTQTASFCERVSKRMAHRPMTDNHEAITRFNEETAHIVIDLIKEHPYLENLPQLKNFLRYEILD